MATNARSDRIALTREVVIETALARADSDGISAVSFRRLGAELGVTPMALYRYVASKDELLAAIVERAFAEFEIPDDATASWQDQLRALARAYRTVLRSHPSVAEMDHAGLGGSALNGLRIVEVVLAALRRAGFSPRESAMLQDRLERFVLALVMQEADGRPRTAEEHEQRVRGFRAKLMRLAPEEIPHVTEAADWLCESPEPDWAFELALDLLIGGLETLPRELPWRGYFDAHGRRPDEE